MMIITITSTLIALGACGVAAWYRSAWITVQELRRETRDRNTEKFSHIQRAYEAACGKVVDLETERFATKAKQSRAGKIARKAQLDRQRALRDNATAALQQGRAL